MVTCVSFEMELSVCCDQALLHIDCICCTQQHRQHSKYHIGQKIRGPSETQCPHQTSISIKECQPHTGWLYATACPASGLLPGFTISQSLFLFSNTGMMILTQRNLIQYHQDIGHPATSVTTTPPPSASHAPIPMHTKLPSTVLTPSWTGWWWYCSE
jgi:hypothetical protein